MSEYENLSVEVAENGKATIILDRPKKMNTLSPLMFEELQDALTELREDNDVRVLVFRGRGENFCAGGDVADDDIGSGLQVDEIRSIRQTQSIFNLIDNFPKPVIAAIRGYALGGGLELACCCDTRIAVKSATFGTPETKLGLIPAGGGTQRLTRLIGISRSRDMVLRGQQHSAKEMSDAGFVHELVDGDRFEEKVDAVVEQYLNRAPIALEIAKHTINRGFDASVETGMEIEAWGAGILMSTDDITEGVEAFQENREPNFQRK